MEALNETTQIQKYPAYKDSGVDWLGEIPAHWEVRKLKYLFQEKKHTTNQSLNCGSISFGKVIVKDDEKIPDSTKASYQEVLSGEFLINPLNLNYDLISLRIALSHIEVVVSPGYIVIKNIVEFDREYFKFLLHRYDVAYMKLLGSGVRQTISFNHIANSLLVLPPLEEQTRIAEFLDRKTAQIDQAIAQKERLIELLNERRQVLIHRAVTRGLNPDAPLKDSGVEWLGEIPAHWEVKKLKYCTKVNPPISYPKSIQYASFVPMEAVGEYGGLDTSVIRPIKEIYKGYTGFTNDDVLIAKITPCFENYKGAVAKGLHNDIAYGTTELHIIRSTGILLPQFIFNITQSPSFRRLGEGTMYGSGGQKRISTDFLSHLMVAIPPLDEQNKIIDFVENLKKKSSFSIEQLKLQIQKLQELKATLINSAVTGKIRV